MIKGSYTWIMIMLWLINAAACRMPASPERYFDAAALNANGIAHFGSDYFITYLGYNKRPMAAGDDMDRYNYEQQTGFAIRRVEGYLKNVNALMPTDDTKALLDAADDLFRFTLESYNTDHLRIAKMIDRKAPQDEVARAMADLDRKSYETFLSKFNKLRGLGAQYAKEHNIPLTEMPAFNR